MKSVLFERIRSSLIEKRMGLEAWLHASPQQEKGVALGPAAEESLQSHLQVLDEAIHMAEEGSLGLCEICQETVEPELLEMDYTASVCITPLRTGDPQP